VEVSQGGGPSRVGLPGCERGVPEPPRLGEALHEEAGGLGRRRADHPVRLGSLGHHPDLGDKRKIMRGEGQTVR